RDRAVLGGRDHVRVGGHEPVPETVGCGAGPGSGRTAAGRVRPWRRSNSGRSERISGRWSKLYGGGGEVVAHSSVFASHGSSPAGWPPRSDENTFQISGSIDRAIVKPPTVAARFSSFQPALLA